MNAPESTREKGTPVGRRAFFGIVGLGAAGIVVGGKVQDWLGRALGPLESKDFTGLSTLIPLGRFRYYSITDSFPKRPRAKYTLKVGGLVERPFTISYAELAAMEPTSITRDFQCVTGWRVPDTTWKGVKLSTLLDRAGVKSGATALRFVSFDGAYTESLTLEQARRDDVLVAYELEGKLLSSGHGGPARLYVAPMYGYKSIKWLESIELTAKVIPGYWERNGYDIDGWVGRSNGRDDLPT